MERTCPHHYGHLHFMERINTSSTMKYHWRWIAVEMMRKAKVCSGSVGERAEGRKNTQEHTESKYLTKTVGLNAIETWQWYILEPFNNTWLCCHQEDSQFTTEWPSRRFSQGCACELESDLLHWLVFSRKVSFVCYSSFSYLPSLSYPKGAHLPWVSHTQFEFS